MSFFKSKKRDYEIVRSDLQAALQKQDESTCQSIMDEVIQTWEKEVPEREFLLGWGLLSMCEFQMASAGKYMDYFLKEYPRATMPVRVEYARFLASTKEEDAATAIVREYLRDIRDRGWLEKLNDTHFSRLGAGQAYLLLTSIYTILGARSYSKRVCEHALKFPFLSTHLARYNEEIKTLNTELADSENAEKDRIWEEFFLGQGSQHLVTLQQWCHAKEASTLARRLELIDGLFRFNPSFKVDEKEIYLLELVGKTPEGKEVYNLG